jgi:hypothetical protein
MAPVSHSPEGVQQIVGSPQQSCSLRAPPLRGRSPCCPRLSETQFHRLYSAGSEKQQQVRRATPYTKSDLSSDGRRPAWCAVGVPGSGTGAGTGTPASRRPDCLPAAARACPALPPLSPPDALAAPLDRYGMLGEAACCSAVAACCRAAAWW